MINVYGARLHVVIYTGSFCATEVSSGARCNSFHWHSGEMKLCIFMCYIIQFNMHYELVTF